jgi:hypothetical protein
VSQGIGAYRDDNAKPWVLPVVKKVRNSLPQLFLSRNPAVSGSRATRDALSAAALPLLLQFIRPAISDFLSSACPSPAQPAKQ